MPFIPHTEDDTREMLAAIGVRSLDDLFDEIPKELLADALEQVDLGQSTRVLVDIEQRRIRLCKREVYRRGRIHEQLHILQ